VSGPTRRLAAALVREARRGDPARAVPHLVIEVPGGGGRLVPLQGGLTLGRGPGADLPLPDPGASRRHARVLLGDDGAAAVEDLGSKNGVRLNGRRLPPGPAALRAGDVLTVGGTALRYVDPLGEGPEAAAPAGPEAAPPEVARARRPGAAGWRLAAAAGLLAAAALLLAAP